MTHQPIEVIHLVFKTHLDIGFTDFARNVVTRYFNDFIPRALALAEELLRLLQGGVAIQWHAVFRNAVAAFLGFTRSYQTGFPAA